MSLNAQSVSKSRQTQIANDKAIAILEDDYALEVFARPCSQSDVDWVRGHRRAKEIKEFITNSGFSKGAQWILWRGQRYREKSLTELTVDLMRFRSILSSLQSMDWDMMPAEKCPWATAYTLVHYGMQFGWQAVKWVELYDRLRVQGRSLNSCYQINLYTLSVIAKNPPYWALPDHILKNLVSSSSLHIKLPDATKGDMIGNIWDYIPASKAWVLEPKLPKKIAVCIGREPWWKRMCAARAWLKIEEWLHDSDDCLNLNFIDFKFLSAQNWHLLEREIIYYCSIEDNSEALEEAEINQWELDDQDVFRDEKGVWKHCIYTSSRDEWYGEPVSRNDITLKFWELYQAEVSKGKFSILDLVWSWECTNYHYYKLAKCEEILELPYGFLDSQGISSYSPFEKLYPFMDADKAIAHCFGRVTKSLRKAWEKAKQNPLALRWAIAIAPQNNIDWQVKFLSMEACIPYCEEAVNFLKSLQPQTALKMLQTFTYKHRGEVHELSDYHYKDTGMLFNNIVNCGHEPQLGRVRCWLTCHEELARQYVAILPNEPVKIPDGWERVQGLCGVKGDWSIQLPTNTSQLKYWGEALHNCVGGYGNSINQGHSIVFVVYWEGQLKYCVEITNSKVSQFYGQRNSSPDRKHEESVCLALEQAGLIIWF